MRCEEVRWSVLSDAGPLFEEQTLLVDLSGSGPPMTAYDNADLAYAGTGRLGRCRLSTGSPGAPEITFRSSRRDDFLRLHEQCRTIVFANQEPHLDHWAPAPAPEAQTASALRPVEARERWAALLHKGLITPEEYQRQKEQLLDPQ